MTVAQLIAELQKMPQDLRVTAFEHELADYDDIVELEKDDEKVMLVTLIGKETE